jgi:uncharacterized protein (DUF2141 family)
MMTKKIFYFIAAIIFLFSITSFHPVEEEGVSVTIINLRNNNGHVLISLFKDGAGYPDEPEKAFKVARLAIFDKKAGTSFTGIPSGNYAVAILHDENDDRRINKNGLGIPKEGYGFSNNVMGAFGPPSYNRAKFAHTNAKVTQVVIKMRY